MRHYLSIVDNDTEYRKKLTDYLNAKDNFPFYVRSYSSINEVESAEQDDLLIVEEHIYEDVHPPYNNLLILSEKGTFTRNGRMYIGKYQSCELIKKDILIHSSNINSISIVVNRKYPLEIISMYSPVKRCGQTTIALALGSELSKRNKTLYINLEGYSGNITEGKNLSDFLFSLESAHRNTVATLGSITESVNGVDVLNGVNNSFELGGVTSSQWKMLLEILEQETDIKYLILDISDCINGIVELLKASSYIITIVKEGDLEFKKYKQYKKSVEQSSMYELIKKEIYMTVNDNNTPKEMALKIIKRMEQKDERY